MKTMKLPELIANLQQQDEAAFNEVYRRYHKLIRYIAYGLTKNHADTDEIVQEVFLQVQKSINDLKDTSQFKAWLSRITYSKAKMLFRKNRDYYMNDEYLDLLQNREEKREEFCPQKKAHRQSDLEVLYDCMRNLKPQYREVLILFFFSQLSIKEIAELTENPEGTIKSRLLYAKKYLKAEIEAYEKANDITLNFHNKTLEATLFMLGGSLVKEPKFVSIPFLRTAIPTSGLLQGIKFSLTAAICLSTALGIKVWIDAESNNTQNTITPKKEFRSLEYQNQKIVTPREAYTVLIDWADCDVEMRTKSEQEIQEILPVYEALIDYQGGYQELLEHRNWHQLIEKYK